MIDATTHDTIRVSTDGGAGPYIVLPFLQLDPVKAMLDSEGVFHWVDEEVFSLDGKPELAVINLGRQVDPVMVQRLLDRIP